MSLPSQTGPATCNKTTPLSHMLENLQPPPPVGTLLASPLPLVDKYPHLQVQAHLLGSLEKTDPESHSTQKV